MNIDADIAANLTAEEREIFAILLRVAAERAPGTSLRVAGGWVRDKLLGVPSADMDIMLDNMSGADFAKLLAQRLGGGKPHVIKTNPEKSKHIETARVYLRLGSGRIREVDFARARSDTYRSDSRIPAVEPATPADDAMRRDLTFNALFWNIGASRLEDFTGLGVSDLASGVARTPADPRRTFADDELRVLRVIRFAARYDATIEACTWRAMVDPALIDSMMRKISRERIGAEIAKMLAGPRPVTATRLLKDAGILDALLERALRGSSYEGRLAPLDMDQRSPHHGFSLWDHSMAVMGTVAALYPESTGDKRAAMLLAALTHDLGKLDPRVWGPGRRGSDSRSYIGHEEDSAAIARLLLLHLRLDEFVRPVSGLVAHHMDLQALAAVAGPQVLRRFVRRTAEAGLEWRDVVNLALADAKAKSAAADPATSDRFALLADRLAAAEASLGERSPDQRRFRPVLDGAEAMAALGISPGPWMAEITSFVGELGDEEPDMSKEEAASRLRARFADCLPPEARAPRPG